VNLGEEEMQSLLLKTPEKIRLSLKGKEQENPVEERTCPLCKKVFSKKKAMTVNNCYCRASK